MTAIEREEEALHEEIEHAETPEDRHFYEEALRDLEQEIAEREQWEEEGEERGWL